MSNVIIKSLIVKYSNKGILVDTNVLLLYLIGNFDVKFITNFKRTSSYTQEDFFVLNKFIKCFKRRLTTPNILTEVSNLSPNCNNLRWRGYFENFKNEIEIVDEKYFQSNNLSKMDEFSFLGLTDSSIIKIAQQKYLVLTDDLPLYDRLQKQKLDAVNFIHIKTANWI